MDDDPHYWAKSAFDKHDGRFDRTVENATQAARQALQSGFLLNGGACIALLGFLAGTYNTERPTEDQDRLVSTIVESLGWFAWGAFSFVAAFAVAYLVNRCAVEMYSKQERGFEHPFIRDTVGSNRLRFGALGLEGVGVLLAVLGLVFFATGLSAIVTVFV